MIADQWVKLVDILKWPGVFFFIVIVTLLIFRRQLAAFFTRLTSISKDGLKASSPTEQQPQEGAKFKQMQQLMQAFDSRVLLDQETKIKQELEQKGLEHEGGAIDVLVRHLAKSQLINTFQETYRIIFGSQIYLLKTANENRATGVKTQFVATYFTNVQKTFTPMFDEWTSEQYVAFLLGFNLLFEQNGAYLITGLGVDFLNWMVQTGVTERKNG